MSQNECIHKETLLVQLLSLIQIKRFVSDPKMTRTSFHMCRRSEEQTLYLLSVNEANMRH